MGSRGRPPAAVTVTDAEREALQRWARRRSTSQALGLRSRVVLGCAQQRFNLEISLELGCSKATVSRWRLRFMQGGLGATPHVIDEFKISPDPLLIENIRDIVGLYLSPPLNAACFAVDEKPQIQALNRTAMILPMMATRVRLRQVGRHDPPRSLEAKG